MSDATTTPTEKPWTVLENEDIATEGFVLVSSNGQGQGYIAPTPTELFASEGDAREATTQLMKQGMPLGASKIVRARLVHIRRLETQELDSTAPKSSIILP